MEIKVIKLEEKNTKLERRIKELEQLTQTQTHTRGGKIVQSNLLTDLNNENDPHTANQSQWRNTSVLSIKTKDHDKSINISRIDSFMTNVSRRYQGEVDDDIDDEISESEDEFYNKSITQKSFTGRRTPLKSQTMRERSMSPIMPYDSKITIKNKPGKEK